MIFELCFMDDYVFFLYNGKDYGVGKGFLVEAIVYGRVEYYFWGWYVGDL